MGVVPNRATQVLIFLIELTQNVSGSVRFMKWGPMAGNFNISVTKTGDQVHLKLIGDFDGSSACELVNLLTNGDLSCASKIRVDTDSLRDVHPFGLNVLRNRLHIENSSNLPLTFTGKLSTQFTAN